jgi:acyl carrier protein
MQPDVEPTIRKFIEDNFLFREDRDALAAEESLLDAGLIDSTGILELVAFLESEFGIAIEDAEIVPDNLDSVRAIAAYVRRKLASVAERRHADMHDTRAGERCG